MGFAQPSPQPAPAEPKAEPGRSQRLALSAVEGTQRKAGIGEKGETANGTAFNAARPKVPAGRAPFLHGEDAEDAEGD